MVDSAGNFYILNDDIVEADRLTDIDTARYKVVYEVIRIIERVPLFLEDHFIRMRNSLSLLGLELGLTQKDLRGLIEKLVDQNKKRNCNVKITVYDDSEKQNCLLYVSKSYYPSSEEIENGVKVGLMRWERDNPNIKLINTTYKDQAERLIRESNAFEVLLVNDQNRITEGSKSNVFFVKGTKVFTAPGEYVLKGVTRKYIIDACRKAGLELIETLISLDSLKDMEGLFISGTSIKVLPVSVLDGYVFESSIHPTVAAIRDQYDGILEDYIERNRF